VAAIALPLVLFGFFVVLFMLRSMMPRGMMKVRNAAPMAALISP
jgi:hypothetical protein